MKDKVGVVILNYKVKEKTLRCIRSVLKSDLEEKYIIVVDNNSDDGIEKELEKMEVKFIQTGKNLGYSGGNNVGIKYALDMGCNYVFILNPDTVIEEKTLSLLQLSLKSSDDVGIVGPKIYFYNSSKIWFAGGIFDEDNVYGMHKGVNEVDKGQYEQRELTDFVTGAAIMVKSEVFEKIGFFDERFFLYYEDLDLCLRAKNVGFKTMYIPEAHVYHENAQSTGLGSSLQDYYITRNRMLLAKKFLPLRTRFALFREALKNLFNPIKRQAFFDSLFGKFGKGQIN